MQNEKERKVLLTQFLTNTQRAQDDEKFQRLSYCMMTMGLCSLDNHVNSLCARQFINNSWLIVSRYITIVTCGTTTQYKRDSICKILNWYNWPIYLIKYCVNAEKKWMHAQVAKRIRSKIKSNNSCYN